MRNLAFFPSDPVEQVLWQRARERRMFRLIAHCRVSKRLAQDRRRAIQEGEDSQRSRSADDLDQQPSGDSK